MENQEPDKSPLKMPPGETRIDYSALNQPEPMRSTSTYNAKNAKNAKNASQANHANPAHANRKPTVSAQGTPNFKNPKPIIPLLLMVFLALVIVAAMIVFFSWKGWLKIAFLDKLLGKTSPSPTIVSPGLSPSQSPQIETSPSLSPARSPEVTTNINDQTRKTDLETIQKALVNYFANNDSYPKTEGAVVKTSDKESPLAQALVPTYLTVLPDDPLVPQYYYGYQSDGANFELTCILEDTSDPAGTKINNYYLYKLTNK
jgi:hypothetical protein